jgi:predicted PurR-regulated permease PerM
MGDGQQQPPEPNIEVALPEGAPCGGGKPAPAAAAIPRTLVSLSLVTLGVLFLWLTLPVDLVIFAGVLLAICLRRAADDASRAFGLPVAGAIAAIVCAALAFFAFFGWFFAQQIASQVDQLSRQLPAAVQKVGEMIGPVLSQHFDFSKIQTSPIAIVEGFFGAATNVVEVIGGVVMMLFLGLYFAIEAELYTRGLLRLVPPARRGRAAEIMRETASAIWYWILGRFFAMAALGMLSGMGLWLIGVPAPVALGILAGILTFVPYLGAVVSAVPSVLMAAAVNVHLAIYVVVLYAALHAFEAYVLVPMVQRRIVHLPPALALSAQVLLGVLGGFLGVLLATPLLAVGIVIVRMAYVEDVLGDRAAEPVRSR